MNTSQPGTPPKKKRNKVLLWILLSLLALVLCAVMVIFAVYFYSVDKLNRPDPTETYLSQEELLREQSTEEAPEGDYPTMDPQDVKRSGEAVLSKSFG